MLKLITSFTDLSTLYRMAKSTIKSILKKFEEL